MKNQYNGQVKSLMDIGYSPGTGLDAFVDLDFTIVGVEPDESRAKFAIEKGHRIHMSEFSKFETDEEFDFITLIHSLEHFQSPQFLLKKALDYAHSETFFYVEVPEALDHVLDWNDSLYLAHISNFNASSLENLAGRCGWELVESINPYLKTPLHQGHLAIVFRPTKTKMKAEKIIDKDVIETIRLRYFNGIPELNNDNPIKFFLKQVNDITLGYKGINKLKKDVHDNYANRTLMKKADNIYLVG